MGQRRKTKDVDRRKTTRYSIIVLDFYCCINNFCKTCWFKTWHIYSFCVRNGLTGWFWPRIAREVAVGLSAGACQVVSWAEGLPGAGQPAAEMVHSLSWLLGAGCWQGTRWNSLLVGCLNIHPYNMAAWLLPRVSDPRESKEEATIPFMT